MTHLDFLTYEKEFTFYFLSVMHKTKLRSSSESSEIKLIGKLENIAVPSNDDKLYKAN